MKNVIHYVLILDKSGSMQDIKELAISSFNEQVEVIKKLQEHKPDAKIKVTFCAFNDVIDIQYTAKKVEKVAQLTGKEYKPDRMTALYDAIGYTFEKVSTMVKPDHKVFIAVFTDGLENNSRKFTAEQVSGIIEKCGQQGWSFKFFCRYEEKLVYRKRLNIDDNVMCCMSLNSSGFQKMKNEVQNSIEKLIDPTKL